MEFYLPIRNCHFFFFLCMPKSYSRILGMCYTCIQILWANVLQPYLMMVESRWLIIKLPNHQSRLENFSLHSTLKQIINTVTLSATQNSTCTLVLTQTRKGAVTLGNNCLTTCHVTQFIAPLCYKLHGSCLVQHSLKRTYLATFLLQSPLHNIEPTSTCCNLNAATKEIERHVNFRACFTRQRLFCATCVATNLRDKLQENKSIAWCITVP